MGQYSIVAEVPVSGTSRVLGAEPRSVLALAGYAVTADVATVAVFIYAAGDTR